MAVSPAQVAELRARTGAGILAAKNALDEANGDTDKAIEILRKKGQAQAVKKADREQHEGGIFIATSAKKAALVFVKCETDFVARSEPFTTLGQTLAQTLHDKGQSGLDAYAKDKVPAAVLELGENVSVGETKVVEAGVIGSYVHSNRKIGVVVGLDGGTSAQATDVAMHAAAMNPTYVKPEEVSSESVAKERDIWKDQLAKEKKPAEIMEKIMIGKEKKFREENALVTQTFVKDQTMTVGKMLGAANVTAYVRVAV